MKRKAIATLLVLVMLEGQARETKTAHHSRLSATTKAKPDGMRKLIQKFDFCVSLSYI